MHMLFVRRHPLLAVAALILVIFSVALVTPLFTKAQEADASRRAELQRQLDALEAQIKQTDTVINGLQGEGASLQRDINVLDGQIKKSRLEIQATDVAISALSENIVLHSSAIDTLSGQLTDEKQALAEILRRTQEYDDYSLIEVVLSTKDVSDFFGDLDSFASLKSAIGESSRQLASTRSATEVEKDGLETQKSQQEDLRVLRVSEEAKVKQQEADKAHLLSLNKTQQAQYEGTKANLEKTAAQIRAALFGLAGGSGAIPFGTAYDDAKVASRATGVRPAFILAILSQESDLGRNVGQCLVKDLTTGDGVGKNTGTPFSGIMKVPRDTVPFQQITAALGRDWSTTVVSCPQPGGYGGAMGPTQFIPSTWQVYASRIASALGVAAADPWNPLHAIMATGLYMADVGAAGDEHTAAAKYYAGGNWATAGQVYANSVMAKAASFQNDINTLEGR
jgi:membrane-bound lytic murein transglycosylase B